MTAVFLIAIMLVVVGIAFYLYFFLKRISQTFGSKTPKKWIKVVTIIAAICLAVSTMMISSMIAIILLHIILIALIFDLANFIIKKSAKNKYAESFSIWKKIYGSGAIPIILTIAILVFGYVNMHNITETKYTIYTDKNIREEGYRVALIADVHFGISLDSKQLQEKCDEISKKKADVVILCGDIIDNSTTQKGVEEVFKALGSIKSNYGVFYVYGNHDRPMSLLKSDYTEKDLIATIEKNGITILQDETFAINDDFVLVGREDRSTERNGKERLTIDKLLAEVDRNDFILTLDHQPNEYAENSSAGTDLLLSGHTHGGQFFPVNYLQEIIPFNDGVYGLYEIDDNTQAIITSGFAGWGYPLKTVTESEYVIIDIKKNTN